MMGRSTGWSGTAKPPSSGAGPIRGGGSARRWSKRCFLGWQGGRGAGGGGGGGRGRPAPPPPQVAAPQGWYIGLAGRGEACLIAAARQPIAVDREIIDSAPPLWDMLTPAEACALRDATDPSRQWLRRWTIKEAYAKLIGDPRHIAAETIETRLIDDRQATAHRHGERDAHCWTRDDGGAIETVASWA